jgi:putative ATPase
LIQAETIITTWPARFIKSIRGSDPDAALYWLARMLESGEDPRFVARRLVIARHLRTSAMPTRRVCHWRWRHFRRRKRSACRSVASTSAQATTDLACAPKSNAAYVGIDRALSDVRQQSVLPVPMHLRDGHYAGAERLGHGVGYQYPHDAATGWLPQDYLGVEKVYYEPVDRGRESHFRRKLDDLRRLRRGESPVSGEGGRYGERSRGMSRVRAGFCGRSSASSAAVCAAMESGGCAAVVAAVSAAEF